MLAIVVIVVSLGCRAIGSVGSAMEQSRIEREIRAKEKAERELYEQAEQEKIKVEQERAEAKAKSEEERDKILINEAAGEIEIKQDGTYMLEVLDGAGHIIVQDSEGNERRKILDVKMEQVYEFEVVTGEKIVLPSDMIARWGIKE